jgi:hypothetical protein
VPVQITTSPTATYLQLLLRCCCAACILCCTSLRSSMSAVKEYCYCNLQPAAACAVLLTSNVALPAVCAV